MTAEEVLARLRDIHEPPTDIALGGDFSPLPLAALAAATTLLWLARRYRRGAWRREARAELRRIDAIGDRAAAWTALNRLLLRVARLNPPAELPPAVFRPDPSPSDMRAARELIAALTRS